MKSKIDILALVVAVIALGLTIWQGLTQIEHNKISVEPRFTSYFSNHMNDGQWGVYILNNGMGTGFVKQLEVLVDGRVVPEHPLGQFYSALSELNLNPSCFIIAAPRSGDSFQINKQEILIESNPQRSNDCNTDNLLLMQYQKSRLDYKLIVESLYGVEFEYQYSTNSQRKR
ncbi:hypothetical protein [Vibrio sp. WXL210]|uniref:hypothetical protein n=1 Tax=Vibrio sp. WXL210 TaxID=3450709 RepID=UPI003EC74034